MTKLNVRLAGIDFNDITDGNGVCISVWAQGCPHHCKGCHNPETWNFDGGLLYNRSKTIVDIITKIRANGITRNLSFLGGEPLCEENREFFRELADVAKFHYPEIKIFCWTGYLIEEIPKEYLENIDVLIDGKFELDKRDITLALRGSSNQRILYKGKDY